MKRRALMLGALAAPLAAAPLAAAPAPRPARGVNLTNWFRFPARRDPAALRAYLSDPAIDDLARAGFSHVRLPVSPDGFDPGLVAEAVLRLQARGLATMVAPASSAWKLEASEGDRAALLAFWTRMAPALQAADPRLTLPEVVNEPVFAQDPDAWEALQLRVLELLRARLPRCTAVLTGAKWGGVDGLLRLRPAPDRDVLYSVHFYEPAELTSLAAYQPGVDAAALASLPFPADDAPACREAVATRDPATRRLADYYCGLRWGPARVGARLDSVASWAAANGPVILGEFGASGRLHPSARLAWLSAVRQAAERRGIGWTLWGYDDAMGFDVGRPPPPRPKLDPALLAALGLRAP